MSPAQVLSHAVSLCEVGVRLRAAFLFIFWVLCHCSLVLSQTCSAESLFMLALVHTVAEVTGSPLWKCIPTLPRQIQLFCCFVCW